MNDSLYRLILSFVFCCCFASGVCFSAETQQPKTQQPNIVLILCDDLGYADVGFNGSTDIQTPQLDQLARQGTVFTSAYAAHPFCGPSRAGMLTGRYPHKFGSQFNIPERGENVGVGLGIPTEEVFFPKVLQQAGYYTGLVGKWHLGENPPFHPNKRGFDDFYGFLGGGHSYHPEQYVKEYNKRKQAGVKRIWSYYWPLEHNGKPVTESEYLTDALSGQGARFIQEASQQDRPFFLYLSYNAPHTPLEATAEDEAVYQHIEDKQRRTYAAMVHAVDRGVGKVVESLKASGEYENTLIVFLSDNGGRTDRGGVNRPLRGGKGDTFEGGYRTPMFFHWAGKVPQQTYPYTVTALDFFPTFARLAGAKIPLSLKLDGNDVWDQVLTGKDARKNEPYFVMRYRQGRNEVGVRQGPWKLYSSKSSRWQLFNMDKDIGETTDLSDRYPDRVKEMILQAKQWSETHVAPKWYDSEKIRDEWIALEMPRFDETFAPPAHSE